MNATATLRPDVSMFERFGGHVPSADALACEFRKVSASPIEHLAMNLEKAAEGDEGLKLSAAQCWELHRFADDMKLLGESLVRHAATINESVEQVYTDSLSA